MKIVTCPYCGSQTKLINTRKGFLYVCTLYPDCNAYVGCHPGTKIPLGTLANPELRNLRIQTHREFDNLWMSGKMTRREAYEMLSTVMGISKSKAHIAKFSIEQCNKLLDYMRGI